MPHEIVGTLVDRDPRSQGRLECRRGVDEKNATTDRIGVVLMDIRVVGLEIALAVLHRLAVLGHDSFMFDSDLNRRGRESCDHMAGWDCHGTPRGRAEHEIDLPFRRARKDREIEVVDEKAGLRLLRGGRTLRDEVPNDALTQSVGMFA